MNKVLEVKNISKYYYSKDKEIEAIKDISFEVYENEFVSIVGPSGCGKSTLLNIIAKLDKQNKGSVTYKKKEPIIGYMFQSDALLPWLNILENACLGLDIMNIKTEEKISETKELLIKYGLKEFIEKYPSELSGGMKQRVVRI